MLPLTRSRGRQRFFGGGWNPFSQLGPTLDLTFAGVPTDPLGVSSLTDYTLNTNFIAPQYQIAAQYVVWETNVGLVDKTFSQIITFTRASTATYFDSAGVLQSAAIDVPRFDYNPATLAARGFLIEEARTNLFPASNDFANATYWTVSGTAVATAGAGTGPDGLNSAVNLAGATDTTLNGNNIEESVSVTASIAYEFSVFVKSNGGTTVSLRLRDSTGGSSSSTAFPVTSTWTRISFNRTMAVGATSVRCIIGLTDGDIFIYGAQLEAGAFPTSYIPTTTTALTRAVDVASVNTLSPWYNAVAGTLYAEIGSAPVNTIAQIAYELNDNLGGGLGRIFTRRSGSATIGTAVIDGGATQADVVSIATVAGSATYKVASAFAANDFAISLNGASVVTDTSGTMPSTIARLFLGQNYGGTQVLNGYLRRITYYPRRLSNAQLQQITA